MGRFLISPKHVGVRYYVCYSIAYRTGHGIKLNGNLYYSCRDPLAFEADFDRVCEVIATKHDVEVERVVITSILEVCVEKTDSIMGTYYLSSLAGTWVGVSPVENENANS